MKSSQVIVALILVVSVLGAGLILALTEDRGTTTTRYVTPGLSGLARLLGRP